MRRYRVIVTMVAAMVAMPATAPAQTPYKLPPAEIVAILDAPQPPRVVLSPARDAMLLVESQPYPPIADLAEPMLRLAGVRINPRLGALQRLVHIKGLSVRPFDGSPARRLALPPGASVQWPIWSNDGKRIAFLLDKQDGVELWVADAATGGARPIAGVRINDALAESSMYAVLRGDDSGAPYAWLSDNRHLLARLVPRGRGPAPAAPRTPTGPNVQETSGRRSQMPTFPDLLASPHDEDLFQYFATSQLGKVDSETDEVERIGVPGLIMQASASPNEKFVVVTSVRRPFSYRVPYEYFARRTEVWDAAGRPVAMIADLPISDEVPRQGVPTGPRDVAWQPLHDASLIWTEALDGGDPRAKAPHRDRIMALAAPISALPAEVMKVTHRLTGLA